MSFDYEHAASRLHVPEPNSLVVRSGQNPALIGAPCHAPDCIAVAIEHSHTFASAHVPKPQATIVATGEGTLSVWTKSICIDGSVEFELDGGFRNLRAFNF